MTRLLVLIVGTCALALLIGLIDPPGERAVAIRLNADLHGSAVSGVDEAATLEFYQQRHHRLAWWQDGTWRPETGIALNWLTSATNPSHGETWHNVQSLSGLFSADDVADLSPETIAMRERVLTQTLLTVARHNTTGHIDPAQTEWMAASTGAGELPGELATALDKHGLADWLNGLAPVHPGYAKLLPELWVYQALEAHKWDAIDALDIVRPGTLDPRIPAIRARVQYLGELGFSVVRDHGANFDDALNDAIARLLAHDGLEGTGAIDAQTLALLNAEPQDPQPSWIDWIAIPIGNGVFPGTNDPRLDAVRERLILLGDLDEGSHADAVAEFDAALSDAVTRFQERHGLEATGTIDLDTITELNVRPEERAATIQANLERMHWLPAPSDLESRHVVVNIPGFELVAFEAAQPVFAMPVVVGKGNTQTPIISDTIVNLKFAPAWTVPYSIASREYLPMVQKDVAWLADHNFRVFTDWSAETEVDPTTVDWQAITDADLPYVFRQNPSAWSAMGLIRFSLTNPYNIYLHDTGYRNAFALTFRDLSHGCVRIGDPTSLARFALSAEPSSWSDADIQTAMNADDTHFHDLAEPLPVHMRYLTAWIDDQGRLQFRRDIYGRDKPLLALLDESDKQVANNLNNLLVLGNPTTLAEHRSANAL